MIRRTLARIHLALTLLIGVSYWAIGGVIFVLMGLVLVPLLPRVRSRAIGQWLLQRAFSGFMLLETLLGLTKFEFEGLEALNLAQGGLVVAPNHPALWDATFVIARVQGLRCILKASLMRNPFLAGGATLAGFIPNKPTHKMMMRSIEALKAGERLLFFPEGTRTRKAEGVVNAFPGGIGIIAVQSGRPVWPVFIRTNSDFLSKGWPLWRPPDRRMKICLKIGEPVVALEGEDAAGFTARLQKVFLKELG